MERKMEPRDFADLVDILQGWIEAHIDTLNIWSGDHMAHAVDACVESGADQ